MPRFDQDWNDTGRRLACQHRSLLTLPAASPGVVGPISGIPAEDRPANIDCYIGRPILSHGWTDQDQRYWQETGKPTQIDTLASQHRLIHWPPIFGHCSIKIRNIGKRPAGQHKSIHWPPISAHGLTKIRNTDKRPAGQHKSIYCRQSLAMVVPR